MAVARILLEVHVTSDPILGGGTVFPVIADDNI